MYIPGIIILVFFAVIGLAVFVGTIIKANMNADTSGFVLLIPYIDEDSAEIRIRSAAAIYEAERSFRVVIICGHDQPAREICERMKTTYPYLEIIEKIEEL